MILSSLFGILLGTIAGLLPGIGSSSIILILLPVFFALTPMQVLMAYLGLIISSQYVASVTAIHLGVPGAESAAPTAKEYANLRYHGLSDIAIVQNARSSLIGNLVGMGIFLCLVPLFYYFAQFYKNDIKIGILCFTYLAVILTADKKLEALLSILVGSFLMSLGYNEQTFQTFDLGIPYLSVGIPWITLVMGALMGSGIQAIKPVEVRNYPNKIQKLKIPYFTSALRGSFLGFLIGFVPGLSYILSSIIAYLTERKILQEKEIKNKVLGSLAASESGHNAGTIAMLIPLLVFGIPITASEGIILNIITINTTIPHVLKEVLAEKYTFLFVLFLINLFSYWIAMRGRFLVDLFFKIPSSIIKILLFTLGLVGTYFSLDYAIVLGIVVYLITLAIFYIWDINPLPFVIAVILFTTSQSAYYLFIQV